MAVQTLEQLKALQLLGSTYKTVKTNGGSLTLRDQSSTTGGVITNIPNGTVLIVYKVSTINGWDAVGVTVNGKDYIGFVSNSYLVASTKSEIDKYLDSLKTAVSTIKPAATATATTTTSAVKAATNSIANSPSTVETATAIKTVEENINNQNQKSMLEKVKELVQKPIVVALGVALATHLVDRFVVFKDRPKKSLNGIGRGKKRRKDILMLK